MTYKMIVFLSLTLLFIGCVPEDKVKIKGLKDKTAPLISLTNIPSIINASHSSSLNISVTSTEADFTHYIYKLGNSSLDCTDSSGYSAEMISSLPITDSIVAFSSNSQNVNTKICAIGIDANSNRSRATSVGWLVDTITPVATISGSPSLVSNDTVLSISVSAVVPADIVTYKYKLGESATTDCSISTGYSAARAQSTLITDDVSLLNDDLLKVCIVAIDFAGNEQSLSSATSFEWTKDTTGPVAVLSGVPTIFNYSSGTTINIGVTATVPADILSYRYKIGAAALDCADPLLYSSNILIISNILDNISSFTTNSVSNNTKICVLAVDSLGNVQDASSATTASWLTDLDVPVATLTGAPAGDSAATSLNISLSAVVPG